MQADPTMEFFLEKFKAHNLKATPQRMASYQKLPDSGDHPTVDAMSQIVKNEFLNISIEL
jgi:Fe2+ or Zn2+ uptake regulation protein